MRFALLLTVVAGFGFADTLTLRDGRVVEGFYLGGDARQLRMTVGDKVETFDLSQVAKIEFVSPLTGAPLSAAPPATAPELAPAPTAPPAVASSAVEAKPAEPVQQPAAPQVSASSGQTLNGVPALLAIIAASPNVEKAPEVIANPFTTIPGASQPKVVPTKTQ